jgi:hypothetical protein
MRLGDALYDRESDPQRLALAVAGVIRLVKRHEHAFLDACGKARTAIEELEHNALSRRCDR